MGGRDYGYSYIEINRTAKYAYIYKGGDEEEKLVKVYEQELKDSEMEALPSSGIYELVNVDIYNILPEAKHILTELEDNYPVIIYELDGTETKEGAAKMQAEDVIAAIQALIKPTEYEVKKARESYDNLSDLAKSYVTNYEDLQKAEQEIKK